MRTRMMLCALLMGGMVAGCGGDDPTGTVTPPAPTPQTVAITGGNSQEVTVGQAAPTALSIKVTGSDGKPSVGAAVTWAVTAGGGTVTPATSQTGADGAATAQWTMGHAPGAASVTATVAGITSPATFAAAAKAGAVASIVVTPATASMVSLGATTQLAAEARDQFGNVISGTAFTWSSGTTSVATVDATGVATAVANGTATITATSGTTSAGVPVTVQQVVASLVLTPLTPSIAQGGTVQLAASARDARNNVLTVAPAITWTSGTQSVATVNASGVVTGAGAGTSNITASVGSINASTAVSVIGSLNVTSNTSLSGTMTVADLTVANGATVTASGDLNITVLGAVNIGGTITGDCKNITVTGKAAATYSGTITNTCTSKTAARPAMVLRNSGALTVTNASLNYAGALTLSNRAIAGVSAGARAGATSAPRSNIANSVLFATAGPCVFTKADFKGSGTGEDPLPGTVTGEAGRSANSATIDCDGDITFGAGSGFASNNGQAGGNAAVLSSGPGASATGGNGGNGGDVSMVATGNITFSGATISVGSGGAAGSGAMVGSDPGGNAVATGGNGGDGGALSIQALGNITIPSGGLTIALGKGGDGGNTVSFGGNGRDASNVAATAGGSATATGGRGGNSTLGVLGATGTVTGRSNIIVTGGDGGAGGGVVMKGGNGGKGNTSFQDGANAGASMSAVGGAGGIARTKDIKGTIAGRSGDGGDIEFNAGSGGAGANRCTPAPALGGSGGKGSSATGHPGAGGAGDNPGTKGKITVATGTGDGGRGDNGSTPGVGGAAGIDGIDAGYTRRNDGPAFTPGANGVSCVQTIVRNVSLDLSALPANSGYVAEGTHVVPIRDATTGAQIGTVSLTTLGSNFTHFFGSGPNRIGTTGGNGWRVNVGNLVAAGLTNVRVQSVTFTFLNTTGVSSSNPIQLQEQTSNGVVIKTTPAPGAGQSLGTTTVTLDLVTFLLLVTLPPGSQADMIINMAITYTTSGQ